MIHVVSFLLGRIVLLIVCAASGGGGGGGGGDALSFNFPLAPFITRAKLLTKMAR